MTTDHLNPDRARLLRIARLHAAAALVMAGLSLASLAAVIGGSL